MSRFMMRIDTDGVVSSLAVPEEEKIAEALGCQVVDVIRTPGGVDVWVDDEGLFNGSQPNIVASLLIVARVKDRTLAQMIHGDVLLASFDEDGNTVALTGEQTEDLTRQLRGIHGYAIDHGLLGRQS